MRDIAAASIDYEFQRLKSPNGVAMMPDDYRVSTEERK